MNYKSVKIIFISYLLAIFLGALFLKQPLFCNVDISFIDALFTSTSATCVTGLIVKNTETDFTIYGQILIALLIQIGGFGYMALVTLLAIVIGKKLNFESRMLVKENFDYPTAAGVFKFLRRVFLFVLAIEVIGAILLGIRFSFDMGIYEALWAAIFHSISAFNNAGFSTFEVGLTGYRGDLVVNIVVCLLIILGSVGFFVLIELKNYNRSIVKRLSVHTKIVLLGTAVLLLSGFLVVLSFEWSNPKTLGELPIFEKLLASFFASVNYRTSGFNTIDIGGMKDVTLFFSTLFMMIGGAPGGTAGGIKITTVFVLLFVAYYAIKNSDEPAIFRRTISGETISKALSIIVFSTFYIWASLIIISEIESVPFIKILFEVVSAFATVGLSTGDGGALSASALFGDVSKIVIILLMFVGRVGVLAFTLVLIGKGKQRKIKYPEGKILL